MTTYRRYAFEHPGPQEGHEHVQRILDTAVERYWWYTAPEVGGQAVGRLWFSFTVAGRDRWFVHLRALRLAVDCYYALGMHERDVPEPDWESLAPHTNRGHQRVPAASA